MTVTSNSRPVGHFDIRLYFTGGRQPKPALATTTTDTTGRFQLEYEVRFSHEVSVVASGHALNTPFPEPSPNLVVALRPHAEAAR